MKRAGVGLAIFLLASGAVLPLDRADEPFPPKGRYNNSAHRYFPDLEARLNAVRYGRWRALEIAWTSGIDRRLDSQFSSYLLGLLASPPRFAPEADRVAPRFAREASPIFRALRWGQVLEQQLIDILASPDASPALSSQRLTRSLDLYRRERWALVEPPAAVSGEAVVSAAPVSSRILSAGTRLFASAAEDLAASDFGQQRWKVRTTVAEFDRSYAAERPPQDFTYRSSAPTVLQRYPGYAEHLDRLARFRLEVFLALVPGGETPAASRERDARIADVARRYGIVPRGIHGQ
ncbi:MAG: hypothetical protein ABI682_10185 [Acidobacteriota bacterium]